MIQLSPRQVHLDFHTSEKIPGVASAFNAEEFAATVKNASISSMTVFAKCHHGWLYYPSKKYPEKIHPNLCEPELMLKQVRALHSVGVRAPVYITVQWDYQSAISRPEWLIRNKDGSHQGPAFTEPGFYQSLCINTAYYDYLAEQTAEICEVLGDELDGIFFDIVGIRPCWCSACRSRMKALGIDISDDNAVRSFAADSMDRFKAKMTALVRTYSKDCTIFYNAGHIGPSTKKSAGDYTHFELESLPSGSWGYLHFPVTARYARKLGMDCLGMTGKFHTEWGDFHSLKNRAALEFECFRMLSFGFASSVGDQLEPYGVLSPAAYKLIGSVYSRFAEIEQWARPSTPLTEAAVLTSEGTDIEFDIPASVFGACQLLEELAMQFDIIDPDMDFSGYRLLFIPEDIKGSKELTDKLNKFASTGGSIIAFGKGALDEGHYPDCFGSEYAGKTETYPDFIVPGENTLSNGLEKDFEYVIYIQGEKIYPADGDTVLYARAPYFKREKDSFCSHRYTPSAKSDMYPAAIRKGNVILFSHPLLTQYRTNAPQWCKLFVRNAINSLLGNTLIRHNGPSTMTVSLLDQPEKSRINAHILSYIPVRKSASIDIIEERTKLYNIEIEFNLPYKIKTATLVPDGTPLKITGSKLTIPEVDGYAVIELDY